METMCSVLLGKAGAKGNGCGQTIVLEREKETQQGEEGRERETKQEKRKALSEK